MCVGSSLFPFKNHLLLLVILKHMLQNYKKILNKYSLVTTWTVMLSAASNLRLYIGVLSVMKWYTLMNMHHAIHDTTIPYI